ncbi:MAG: TonB-dependent receptor [Bacteroidales bacterium]|nr:TonB-dependent receptor [Bacteroidales bacterium]
MKRIFSCHGTSLQRALLSAIGLILAASALAQNIRVTGTVTSASDDEPLIGVAVLVDGTTQGVTTDIDGMYTLPNVDPNATLSVSYVGFNSQKIKVNGRTQIDIVMQEDSKSLEEVVVIGYGVQKKSNVTGAISSIKSDDLQNSVISDASSALQGKVSGVQVVNSSSAPGSTPTIRVRGYSSNGSSNPLYVVDGLKVNDISHLDPSTIESMEVLKDAASAAIYGAEAGNGVILITTKRGQKGKTKVTLDAQLTFTSQARSIDLMNAQEYYNFYSEGVGDAFTQLYDTYYIPGTDTDWQDEVYGHGTIQKYNVGLQGGNDQGQFFLTLGYLDNDGMVKLDKDYYKRISGQINASYKIRPWLEVGTNNTVTHVKSSSLSENNQYGIMRNVMLIDPLTPVYYNELPDYMATNIANGLHPIQAGDGSYYGYSWQLGGTSNPIAAIENQTTEYTQGFVNGSTYINLSPFKGFLFTSRLGYTLGSVNENDFHPTYLDKYNSSADTDLRLQNTTYQTTYYQWENFANYNFSLADNDFGLMVGMSYSDYEQNYSGGLTNQLSSDQSNFWYLNYSTNGADDYVMGGRTQRRKISYFGRLSWAYADRYFLQANFRADSYDSAYLDLNHNWGYFPSVSLGWTFSNESFIKDHAGTGFNFGKLRASYGVNGSISNLGGYMYAATLQTGQYDLNTNTANMAYWLDNQLYQGTYPSSSLANPKLRWERSKQVDLGLDLRFLQSRLLATFDYYYKITDGLLVQSLAPLSTGTTSVYQNLGKVTNEGFEAEVEWRDQIGDFGYSIKANIATVKNNVKEYRGVGTRLSGSGLLAASSPITYFEEGYPLWYIRGYQLDGVNSADGSPIFHDFDNDGEITEADRTNLGSAIPDFTYGISINLFYKGFDLSAYGAGASGNKLVYGMMSTSDQVWVNRPAFSYEDRWTPTNTNASMPSAQYQIYDPRIYNSSAYVHDASYFKIKQIQLGYSLPKSLLGHLGLETLRAYVSLDNFFTFTNYPGSDPEINGSAIEYSAMPIDFGGYPMCKSVSFGLNVAF